MTAAESAPGSTPRQGTPAPPGPPTPPVAGLEIGREIVRRFHALPAERLAFFRSAAEIAAAGGSALYWVGGGVRDLWLGTDDLDIDLALDGDFQPFAAALASRHGTVLRAQSQFMTGEMNLPGGTRVDLARTRAESYPEPASLPAVAEAPIADDLARRDFTVNCLAVPLAPTFGDRLLDPCAGLADLEAKCLRTLHRDSFRDDPTRLFRAVELEARLGFRIDRATLSEAVEAVAGGLVERLSPARLREALRRALGRPATAPAILRRLFDLGLVGAGLPAITTRRTAEARFAAALEEWKGSSTAAGGPATGCFALALLCLACDLPAADRGLLARRLDLGAPESALVTRGPDRLARAKAGLSADSPASVAHDLLASMSAEELALAAGEDGGMRSWVRRELGELRPMRLAITGADLLAAGLAAGPELGRALALTLQARLNGQIGQGEELEFALRVARTRSREGVQ